MGFQRASFRRKLAEMKEKKAEIAQQKVKEIYTRKERRVSKLECHLARTL